MGPLAERRPAFRSIGTRSIILSAGLALNSGLGPLLAEVMDYPVTETMRNQTLGLDAVSLLLVAPLSLIIGVLALRGHPAAPALALGPSSYTAYMFVQYVVGPDYLYSPAPLLFHLALFILGWSTAVLAWHQIGPEILSGDRRRDRVLGTVLLLLAAFVLLRYLPTLAGSFSQAPLTADARADPAMFWTILLLDLGVIVPVASRSGIDLLSAKSEWARKTGFAIIGWFALVAASVTAMGFTMVMRDDPYGSAAMMLLFGLAALLAIAAAGWLFAPLFARDSRLRRARTD